LVKDAGKIETDESIHIRVSQGSLDDPGYPNTPKENPDVKNKK